MADYRLGWRYSKIIQYNITKALTKGPALPIFTTNMDTINASETKTYTLASNSCLIESVIGTNITCNYNEQTKTLTLSNPTGPVSLKFITYYNEDNLCWLYFSGAMATDGTRQGSWPNKGTVSYIDKYNEQKTINIADLGLYISSSGNNLMSRSLDVKLGCDVVCKNVGLGYYRITSAYLRFSNTSASYDYQATIIGDNVLSTYTFNDVIKVPSRNQADIVIKSTIG